MDIGQFFFISGEFFFLSLYLLSLEQFSESLRLYSRLEVVQGLERVQVCYVIEGRSNKRNVFLGFNGLQKKSFLYVVDGKCKLKEFISLKSGEDVEKSFQNGLEEFMDKKYL